MAPQMSADVPCEQHLEAAGLPHRTEIILARERRSYPGMVETLVGGAGKGQAADSPTLTTAALRDAATGEDPIRRFTAAFLIGRCRATEAAADQALDELARELLDADGADVAIEPAMSLALRGAPEPAVAHLRRAAASEDIFSDAYKAAFFLAQLGDASGWPAMVRTLESEIPHYRLMALRHLIAFEPFAGQTVGEHEVDVRKRLLDRLADPDPLVRQEVPFYLEELAPPDLAALLEPVARSDEDENVRNAARLVLERQ